MQSDVARDNYLKSLGLSVLRFSNRDVLSNMDGVITSIIQYVEAKLAQEETKSP